jgi:hypothetical protein
MNDKEFIQQGSIAAMQGIMSQPHNLTPTEIAEHAFIKAQALLKEVRKKYSLEENNEDSTGKIMDYIQEVDEVHGKYTLELIERLDQLEHVVQNLQRIAEQNSAQWINKPPLTAQVLNK